MTDAHPFFRERPRGSREHSMASEPHGTGASRCSVTNTACPLATGPPVLVYGVTATPEGLYALDEHVFKSLTAVARHIIHRVSFSAVTQQINSATSMGRLMLTVLPSFAQFERRVTGERIRDRIAASKAKGMWMGGPVPLGYVVRNMRELTQTDKKKPQLKNSWGFRNGGAGGNRTRVRKSSTTSSTCVVDLFGSQCVLSRSTGRHTPSHLGFRAWIK
jgi:hypothetical protein